MKKIIKIGMGTLIVGGIATGIAVPLSTKVKEKTDVIPPIDGNGLVVEGGGTVEEWVAAIEKTSEASPSLFSESLKATGRIKYEEEQKGSLEIQSMNFNYEIYKLNQEVIDLDKELKDVVTPLLTNADITIKEAAEARKKAIEDRKIDIADSKKKNSDKILAITNNTIDYSSDKFAYDYPDVLATRANLIEKQKKILDDQKDAYIKQFNTLAEGKAGWIDQLKKQYNGALTDDEAVEGLVDKVISGPALKQYGRSLQSNYTIEQALAKVGNDYVYEFLHDYFSTEIEQKEFILKPGSTATQMTTENISEYLYKTPAATDKSYSRSGTEVRKSDKVYFLGTQSLIKEKIIADIQVTDQKIIDASDNGLIKVSHMLIAAIQNEGGYTLPWTVTKETVKKLFAFYGAGSKNGTGTTQWSDEIDKVFESTKNPDGSYTETATQSDITESVIKNASDNAGSKDTSGDLGTKNDLETVKGFVPGFGIGLLQAIEDIHTTGGKLDPTIGDAIISAIEAIGNDLESGANLETHAAGEHNPLANNDSLNQYIDSLSENDFNTKFGNAFKNAFSGDLEFVYKTTNGYIINSKNGIHLVKVEEILTPAILSNNIKEDISIAMNDQGASKITNNYNEIFSSAYSPEKILKELIGDGTTTGVKFTKEIYDIMPDMKKDDGTIKTVTEIYNELSKYIEDSIKSKAISAINSVFTDTIQSYLTNAYDNNMREITLSLPELYGIIEVIANREAGL